MTLANSLLGIHKYKIACSAGNLLLTASSADLGNCLLSLMSACKVGKVALCSTCNYYSLFTTVLITYC